MFKKKKKVDLPKVIATCPHCKTENGLAVEKTI
jgi:hypothetical protein